MYSDYRQDSKGPTTPPDPPPIHPGLINSFGSPRAASDLVGADVDLINEWIADGRLAVTRRDGKRLVRLDEAWALAIREGGCR